MRYASLCPLHPYIISSPSLSSSLSSSPPPPPIYNISTHMAGTFAISPAPCMSLSPAAPSHFKPSVSCRLDDAAKQTVDLFVKDGMLLGLGTGSGSAAAISYIGQKLSKGTLRDVVGVPMSSLSAAAAAQAGLPLRSHEDNLKLDFAFDDADMIQEGTLFAIVGQKGVEGRESIIKEKVIAQSANQFVFIIDESKFVQELIGAVPVYIKQDDWLETAEEIDDLFLGDAEVWRRPSFGEAGPLGGDFPFITKEGHFVLDVVFTSTIANPSEVAESLEAVEGVVAHGLILDAAYAAAVDGTDGVKIRTSLFRNAFKSMG